MKNNSLVIMAGGASSRMKKSLDTASLSSPVRDAAKNLHKSLIPLDQEGKPLLYFLLRNAIEAGISSVYLITSPENSAFSEFVHKIKGTEQFEHLDINFAIQRTPENRQKPLGTADALQQCIEQHSDLLRQRFTVCNGDNLYSTTSLKQLQEPRNESHALIAYDGLGLGHSQEKIQKFALLDFDKMNSLIGILEKPTNEQLLDYKERHQKLWVSMNIFNFYGEAIFPFLQNCPIHPERQEKELPQAVQNAVHDAPGSVLCFPRSEMIPDLTRAEDISTFFKK